MSTFIREINLIIQQTLLLGMHRYLHEMQSEFHASQNEVVPRFVRIRVLSSGTGAS